MTSDGSHAGATATAPSRAPDLVLARVHLRLGSLSLARVELETMAGRGELDDDGIRDLAEARWRTGDIGGAGEAAATFLESRPDDIIGLVIAAEAQAAAGRPSEARRLAGRAIDRAEGSLDPIFAGMPKASIWPIEPGDAGGPAGVLFDDLHPGPIPLPALAPDGDDAPSSRPASPIDGPSLWGDDAPVASEPEASDAGSLFRAARAALDADRPADAAASLLLALRASPAIAPAVLDLLAGRSEPILALVRGDAAQIVGHEVDAMRDHAAAAATLSERSPATVDDEGSSTDPSGGEPPADDTPPDPHTSDQETL